MIYEDGRCVRSLGWHPSGQLKEKNLYDERGKYREAWRWYATGKVKYKAIFKDGRVVEQVFYDEDGSARERESTEAAPSAAQTPD